MRIRIWVTSVTVVLLFVVVQALSVQWHQWELLNPLPQGRTLNGVASSGSIVVAVGEGGTILTTDNGLDWEIVHSKSGLLLQDVIWAGDRFVAVGGYSLGLGEPAYSPGIIMTSLDGRRWTEVLVAGGTIFWKAIFNGEQILAVGFKGKTATSPDGINWVEHTLADHPNSDMVDVAWNGSIYVAVGAPNYSLGGGMAIYCSEDGISWTMADLEDLPGMSFMGIVWGHDQFLAVGGAWPGIPYVLSSPDGHAWTANETDLTCYIRELAIGPEGFLGVGDHGHVFRSPDGMSWSTTDAVPASKTLRDIVILQDRYLVVGADGAIAISTDFGQAWEVVTTWALDLLDSDGIVDLCWGEGTLVAISRDGKVFRSPDGFDWQQTASFSWGVFSVHWFNGAFWVVGSDGLIATSEDGSSWSRRNSESWVRFRDIATNGDVIVAVGARSLGHFDALVATSTDGIAWSQIDVEGGVDLIITSITWTGTRFVGIGNGGKVFRSEDGFAWSIEELEWDLAMKRVVSNGSVLVALGSNNSDGVILVSQDHGDTWQATFVDRLVRDVVWTGDLFVAAVAGQIWSSHNGDAWTKDTVPFGGASCVVGNREEIMLAGGVEMIMRAKRITQSPVQGRVEDE